MNDQDDTQNMQGDDAAQPQGTSRQTQTSGGNQGGGQGGAQTGDRTRRHGRRHAGTQSHNAGDQPRRQDASVYSSVNMTELRDLVELIATHGFTDFELEREGFRVRLRREQPAQFVTAAPPQVSAPTIAPPPSPPIQTPTPVVPAAVVPTVGEDAKAEASTDADLHTITSPIVGTFYRSPTPTADPFVRAGSTVEPDTVVCIVEAMKLMNEILAETSGTIEKVFVENGQPIEYGQPLFGVRK